MFARSYEQVAARLQEINYFSYRMVSLSRCCSEMLDVGSCSLLSGTSDADLRTGEDHHSISCIYATEFLLRFTECLRETVVYV